MKHFGLLIKLLLGIVLGMFVGILGSWFGISENIAYIAIVRGFATFNSLFSTFLTFLIPLIILSFVTVGLADLGKKANRLFGVTLLLAYGSTVVSGFITFFIGKLILPSIIEPVSGTIAESTAVEPFFSLEIPPVFGVMTALILAFVLGIGMANAKGITLLNAFRELQQIISQVLAKIVIPLIPIHIAGLFCNIAAEGRLFNTVRMFAVLYVIIIVLQIIYIASQFCGVSLYCKKNHMKSIKNILPVYFTALGTQSSATTIPIALKCAAKNRVNQNVADFCIPLCATINLNGDTITLVLGAMGIMIAGGITPSIIVFAPFILMLGITMVAAPGVPGGGVMAALGLISSMLGFTAPMQQLIIALHFSQDSFGTAANVSGDQAIALFVDEFNRKREIKIATKIL